MTDDLVGIEKDAEDRRDDGVLDLVAELRQLRARIERKCPLPPGTSYVSFYESSPRVQRHIRVDTIITWRETARPSDGTIIEYEVGQEARTLNVIEMPVEVERRMLRAMTPQTRQETW